LAGILEQARVLDAALAEQQQQHSAALVAALTPRQQGGSATALLQEMRSFQELRATGAIDDETAGELRVIASSVSDFL
jgi:hypothetical protein